MGLQEGAVRNVLLARDIVPRAFACDYTLVADILKRVSPSFREHRCLSNGARVVSVGSLEDGVMLHVTPGSHLLCSAGIAGVTGSRHQLLCTHLQVLYYAIGRSLILQPGQGHWFSASDPYHPMLPPQAGLYVLQVNTQAFVSVCQCCCHMSGAIRGTRSAGPDAL